MQIYKYISDFTSFLKFFFLFDFCFERFFLSFAKILLRFCFSQNGYKQALRLPFSIGFSNCIRIMARLIQAGES